MKNESIDGANPQAVGGETDKVASACASSSDSGGSKGEGGPVPKILQKFAAQVISPSATVVDPSCDGLKEKKFDAAKKCVMGLQYQVSFEDDGAMSVTIGDSESCGNGHEKGFSTGKFSGSVHQPREVVASSADNSNYVGGLTASRRGSGFTLNPEGVKKVCSLEQEEPGMLCASVPQGSLCDNSSHISTAATPRSKQGSVEQADAACSVNKGSRPVSLIEPAAPPSQPLLCAIADINEPCVRTIDTTQGAVGGSNAAPSEGLALPIDTRTDGCSGRNTSTQSCEDPSEVTPALPSSENADSSNFPAYLDVVSLVDTVFAKTRAAVSTTGSGSGDEAGMVHLLLEEPSLHGRSTSLLRPPLSDPATGKGEVAGQPVALPETIDLTDESTPCPTTAVSPTVCPRREQLSTGVSCPQRAAQGMGQSSVPHKV
ncbi:hypothetical protein HPB50_021505 [Hyalomma asiaticum]|uniref:Uncharacterized protein n=1 Tax=Hyalomma asiaticum TaxID=266040 RepID=A0ACB7SKB8_HYAAI|nr:hypothetical protein HPB50_021505 [Hyalomma asiaticum]